MTPAALRGAIERCGEPVRIARDGEVFSFFSSPGSDGWTAVSSIITVRLTGVGNWSRAAPSSRPQQPAISW